MLRANRSRAESDGGNVTFTRGPQTQDETKRSPGQIGLVRMRHDGRIEQRGGFRRIFVREVSSDERLPFWRRHARVGQVMTHLHEAIAEQLLYLLVAVLEFTQHLLQK